MTTLCTTLPQFPLCPVKIIKNTIDPFFHPFQEHESIMCVMIAGSDEAISREITLTHSYTDFMTSLF